MSEEEKDALLVTIEQKLNTTDKRWMYLQIEFPEVLKYVNIEGSPWVFSMELFSEFRKRGIEKQLKKSIDKIFKN